MKIWFPVKSAKCNVKIKILDSKMKPVRNLLYKKLSNGYYNIYWDKKDDSGNYVPKGNYNIATVSCDYKKIKPMNVSYASGETSVLFSLGDDLHNPSIELTLLQDSLVISLEIVNIRMNHTANLFSDSLLIGETASFIWQPDKILPTGTYYYKLKVNDFEHLILFKYKK